MNKEVKELTKNLGKTIKLSRTKIGAKQKDLARKVGITQSYLCQIENGQKIPELKLIEKISVELGLSTSMLLLESFDFSSIKSIPTKDISTFQAIQAKTSVLIDKHLMAKKKEISQEIQNTSPRNKKFSWTKNEMQEGIVFGGIRHGMAVPPTNMIVPKGVKKNSLIAVTETVGFDDDNEDFESEVDKFSGKEQSTAITGNRIKKRFNKESNR
jgi:putative transcriptional regulator